MKLEKTGYFFNILRITLIPKIRMSVSIDPEHILTYTYSTGFEMANAQIWSNSWHVLALCRHAD